MGNDDAFGGLQAMAENVPDKRPIPPLVGLDQYFDEPEPTEDERIGGMLGWAAKATKEQRGALLRLTQWMHEAPDAERRVILILMEQYEGRLPRGAVADIARTAGVQRKRVWFAVSRFAKYFPDAVAKTRGVKE
jgi:hypothetical protein